MIVTPDSELDAINEILTAIGSSPVNSLEDDANADVINARSMLYRVSREVQSKGYLFNTEYEVELLPDFYTKKIQFPNSFIRVIGNRGNYVRRDGFFFDLTERTSKFPDGITLSTLVREVNFEDLPEAARKMITARSARIFQARYLSAQELDAELQQAESQAQGDLLDYELETSGYNIYSNDAFVQQQIQRN